MDGSIVRWLKKKIKIVGKGKLRPVLSTKQQKKKKNTNKRKFVKLY